MSSKLQHEDIPLGMPLAWHVYDKSGNLLMHEGAVIETQKQIDGLCARGLYREKSQKNARVCRHQDFGHHRGHEHFRGRVQAGRPFGKVGEEVSISLCLQFAEENQVFMIPAMIRNVHQEMDARVGSEVYMHGMEFIQTQSMDLAVLQNYIYKFMLES